MVDVVLAASAVVVDAQGRVLLVKRGAEPEKGRWSVPGGSKDPGETLAEAAAREAFEETGLHVQIVRELWVATVPTGDGRQFEIHDFLATTNGGTLTPGDDADDARWVAPDELDGLPLTAGLAGYLERAGLITSR
ncbi:MAG: NUDIX domain-containing protein [Rhodococcus sp. (in: high G+C Gram-positive bacteria)]